MDCGLSGRTGQFDVELIRIVIQNEEEELRADIHLDLRTVAVGWPSAAGHVKVHLRTCNNDIYR